MAACADEGRVTVVVDTTGSSTALEVLALPIDPATIAPSLTVGASEARGTPRGDSIARFVSLRDSAASIDADFQRERAALNADAERFATLDRTSADYARAWDAHRARLVAAERLRATRDRLRGRAAALAKQLGDAVPPDDSTRRAQQGAARRQAFDTASDGSRSVQAAGVREGSATLTLEAGTWWLGATPPGAAPSAFTRIELSAGARDTVRLRR